MKVIVIGASHAGIAFAMRAKEQEPEAEIVLYDREDEISFISQSIPLYLMGKSDILTHGNYTSVKELEGLGIKVKNNTVVEAVDVKKKTISYVNVNESNLMEDTYDKLVLATGSFPSLPLFSTDSDHVHVIKSVHDAKNLTDIMKSNNRVVVIGGGLIGVEISRILGLRGIPVKLLHPHAHILNKYVDEDLANQLTQELINNGVDVHLNTIATDLQIKGNSEVLTIMTDTHEQYEAEDVIVAIGFRPNSLLLRNDATLGDMGAILVDEYMQTSIPDIFAVGDCATSFVNRLKDPIYMPHASEAIRQGQVAALNLVKPTFKIPPSQNTYNMNLEGLTLCTTGLTLKMALANGIKAKEVIYRNDSLDGSHYLEVFFVYEEKTYKIIGAQFMATTVGVSEYVNILSLAIQENLSIFDMEFSDFYFEHGYKNPHSFTSILAKLVRQNEDIK